MVAPDNHRRITLFQRFGYRLSNRTHRGQAAGAVFEPKTVASGVGIRVQASDMNLLAHDLRKFISDASVQNCCRAQRCATRFPAQIERSRDQLNHVAQSVLGTLHFHDVRGLEHSG